MKVGEIWMNSTEGIAAEIVALEPGYVVVRHRDAAQSAQSIQQDSFVEHWEKVPKLTPSDFLWPSESDHEPDKGTTIFRVSAGGRKYAVLVSDEAMQDLRLQKCKAIAEKKITATPWVKHVEVRSTD